MKRLTAYFTLILSLIFCAFFQMNTEAQEVASYHFRVCNIEVAVNSLPPGVEFDNRNLLSRLKTKQGCVFSQADFDADLKALASEFDRVDPILDFSGDQVTIVLELSLKPVIRKIHWKGNHRLDNKCLQEALEIACGSVYEHHTFNEAFHKIKALYVKKGYFEAELNYQICHLPGCNEIDIEICIHEGRAGRIKNIYFEGLCPKEESEITECMITKEYCSFTSWLTETGSFNEEALEQDRLSIIQYLQNEGYADAKVEVLVCGHPTEDAIDIKIIVCKGEIYYFGEVCLSGHTLFTCDQISQFVVPQKGAPFSPEKMRETVRSIQNLYGVKGYIETVVSHHATLNECRNTYDVRFHIEEGEQFRVGLIKILGNTVTNTRVILNESLLIPGEIFDIRKLKATECRLEMIGFFKCVNVYPVKSTLGEEVCGHFRDVHIEVVETTTGSVGFSTGYSSTEALYGGVELSENNFNIRGIFSILDKGFSAIRGNGEFFQFKTTVGTRATTYGLRWAQPFFEDTPWVVGFDGERSFNRAVSNDYDIDSIGFKVYGTYPINRFVRYTLYYRYENSHVRLKNDLSPTIRSEEKKEGPISAVGHTLCYDSTDCPVKPSKGFRSTLTLECAGMGGHFNFLALNYINSYYHPVNSKGTLKFRVDAKFIQPVRGTRATDLPLAERYFLGGEDTVRGYRAYALGPQFTTGDPTGGISSLLLSEEYLHRICDRLDAFVFVDAGSISLNAWQIGPIQASVGGGLRFEVINNTPVIVGMGWPLNARDRSQVKRFFLSFGGRF